MRRRHPLPKIWLMTDSRIGDVLAAVRGLPRGSGIIFRHYELPTTARRALFRQVHRLARKYRHTLILGDTPMTARAWGADGAHCRSPHRSQGLRTVAVHNAREAARARAVKADLIFVSPVFATRSHPGAKALGRVRLGLIAGGQRAIALGGMTAKRARGLSALNIYGWAGIDAFKPTRP